MQCSAQCAPLIIELCNTGRISGYHKTSVDTKVHGCAKYSSQGTSHPCYPCSSLAMNCLQCECNKIISIAINAPCPIALQILFCIIIISIALSLWSRPTLIIVASTAQQMAKGNPRFGDILHGLLEIRWESSSTY